MDSGAAGAPSGSKLTDLLTETAGLTKFNYF